MMAIFGILLSLLGKICRLKFLWGGSGILLGHEIQKSEQNWKLKLREVKDIGPGLNFD